ncbi:MAG TPA: hypothetical protein VMB71_08670 [Acetobacteraceae bacterium]|nr:hypothetical protein [Acetobacteraceae bacterium]
MFKFLVALALTTPLCFASTVTASQAGAYATHATTLQHAALDCDPTNPLCPDGVHRG